MLRAPTAPCRNWGLVLGGTKAIPTSPISPPMSNAPAPCLLGGLQLNSPSVTYLCLGLGSQICFPSFFRYCHHIQISRKYPGNGEVLFSALFHLWSQLQRHISALLKEFVDNQLAEWEGVNSTGTTGLCSQEQKISWATLADFYLPPIWERGKKSVFFSLLHFFVLAWTAILFRWASSLLLQYDLESHSFSGCFAWLQALSFLVKMKFIF